MAFADPEALTKEMHLRDGASVADFGAGSGTLTRSLARRVHGGKVYAIEVNKDLLGKIGSSARAEGLTNIFPIWGDIESPHGTKIADNSVEAVIVSNVLFQVEHPVGVIAEAKRVLSSGGSVFVIDWTDSFGGLGPKAEQIIEEKKMKEMWGEGGFLFERSFSAGDHHYGLVFEKP